MQKKLVAAALKIRKNAYAPYSGFKVGAAIETQTSVYSGVNVENSSYGATICAERNAIFQAVSREGNTVKIKGIAIATSSSPPAVPCGLCLQVISEFSSGDIPVFLVNEKGETLKYKLSELFPHNFTKEDLLKIH
ncbi:MAG: cytidine deaminase [Deltaproteobacteria bacterium]|nr:cytidine deaminase [Deltaproteobacteria bacterium]